MLTKEDAEKLIESINDIKKSLDKCAHESRETTSTLSVAQDALLAGFQPTCDKGLAVLLGVDDMTIEACKEFEPRHQKAVEEYVANKNKSNLEYMHERPESFKRDASFWPINFFDFRSKRTLKKQSLRKYSCSPIEVGEAQVDIVKGVIKTELKWVYTSHAWAGLFRGSIETFPEEKQDCTYTVETIAKRGVVKKVDYNDYGARLIPDEAVETVKEAIAIGLTDIQVAYPMIEDGEMKRDPIIVGYVNKQMYMIAWFGYDPKNHNSCNI